MDINNNLKWSNNWCLYFDMYKCNALHSGKKYNISKNKKILIVTISFILAKLIIKLTTAY